MNPKQILQARWFPNVATHLLAGLAAAGVVFGLRALGITSVVPWEVNSALTPIVGFLVAAVVRKPYQPDTPEAEPADATQGTLGSQVAEMLAADAREAIDANPGLFKSLALDLLTGAKAINPAPLPAPAQPTEAQTGQETGVIK